ncbi:hypothetical protein Hdeb2414_s0021g00577281 [Helianthus debilis subsp. tardiflorus]
MVRGWVKRVVDLFAKRCRWCPVVPTRVGGAPWCPRGAGGTPWCRWSIEGWFFGIGAVMMQKTHILMMMAQQGWWRVGF